MKNGSTNPEQLKQQYTKEYKRIMQAVKRQQKLGYIVPENVRLIAPPSKAEITEKSVAKLTTITPNYIRTISETDEKTIVPKQRKNSTQEKTKSGKSKKPSIENIEAKKVRTPSKRIKSNTFRSPFRGGRTQKQTERIPKKNEANLNSHIIGEVRGILDTYHPPAHGTPSFIAQKESDYNYLINLLDTTIEQDGEYETAYRIEEQADDFFKTMDKLLHASGSKDEEIEWRNIVARIIKGRALTIDEQQELDTAYEPWGEITYNASDIPEEWL